MNIDKISSSYTKKTLQTEKKTIELTTTAAKIDKQDAVSVHVATNKNF